MNKIEKGKPIAIHEHADTSVKARLRLSGYPNLMVTEGDVGWVFAETAESGGKAFATGQRVVPDAWFSLVNESLGILGELLPLEVGCGRSLEVMGQVVECAEFHMDTDDRSHWGIIVVPRDGTVGRYLEIHWCDYDLARIKEHLDSEKAYQEQVKGEKECAKKVSGG